MILNFLAIKNKQGIKKYISKKKCSTDRPFYEIKRYISKHIFRRRGTPRRL